MIDMTSLDPVTYKAITGEEHPHNKRFMDKFKEVFDADIKAAKSNRFVQYGKPDSQELDEMVHVLRANGYNVTRRGGKKRNRR